MFQGLVQKYKDKSYRQIMPYMHELWEYLPKLKHYRLKSVGFGAKAPIVATESRCQSKDLFARLKVCLSSTQVAVIPLP